MPKNEAGAEKKKGVGGGNKKGNGTKARHKFVKEDGRSLNIITTEAKGLFTVRATLSTPNTAAEGEPSNADKSVGKVKQFTDRVSADAYFAELEEEARGKDWLSRKSGGPASSFSEIPD